jgi:hypothetical protein
MCAVTLIEQSAVFEPNGSAGRNDFQSYQM